MQPESKDTCSRRNNIRAWDPEDVKLTYRIHGESPNETTRTDQAKSTMAKRSLRVNDEAGRNTTLVKTQSKSNHQAGHRPMQVKRKAKASGKMRPKEVQRWDESKWKNEIKQAKLTKISQKISEVEDLQNPETKAAEICVGQQWDVPKRITKRLPKFRSLPNNCGKQQLIWVRS